MGEILEPADPLGASRGLARKRELALERLRGCGGVVVALSGGVDSAVLLALALEALGAGRVLAATGISPSLARTDLAECARIAEFLGARLEQIPTHELERPEYRANRGDRCFHCRSELFAVLHGLARDRGLPRVAYGAIVDDLGDFRPGMRAAAQWGAVAPLLEAGLRKDEVRRLARAAGLFVADKPAGACLASRLPVGTEVTLGLLARVERAEAALREMGFRRVRVRHHGEVARIELDAEELARALEPECRSGIARAVREAGYRYVALDLEGYRPGSLNSIAG